MAVLTAIVGTCLVFIGAQVSPLHLNTDAVARLRSLGVAGPAPDDLAGTYAKWEVVAGAVLVHRLDLTWSVVLREPAGQMITTAAGNRLCLRRTLLAGPRDEDGLVLEVLWFFMDQENQHRGHGSAVHAREIELCRRWAVRQVHLDAIDEGRVFWIHKMGYRPVDFDTLWDDYVEWCASGQRLVSSERSAKSLPVEYFLVHKTIECFLEVL